MIESNSFESSLFIFNDNEEQHNTNIPGGGSACIRIYNRHNKALSKPYSAGIPTGTLNSGGYLELNNSIKKVIDDAIVEIVDLVNQFNYKTVYYSADNNGLLGTGIFHVDENVIEYVTNKINTLPTLVNK